MKGATTDPCERIINPPKISSTMMIGASQSFFLSIRKFQSSLINSILFKIFNIDL